MARRPDLDPSYAMPGRPNPQVFAAVVLAFTLGLASPLYAQFVKIEAGASDVLPSEGGTISFQSSNYTSYFSAGAIEGNFSLGAYIKTKIDSHVVTLGDQSIAFDLPTDIFGTNQAFLMRGIGITAKEGKANVFLLGGATALASGTQFFQAARADSAAGMLFTDAPLSDKLHFYSKNVISRRFTSIQAIDWRPRKWLRTGLAGGIGSDQPYLAATADVENNWLSIKAAYISASDRFRRLTEPSVFASEVDRENILAVIRPYSEMFLTVGHQNFLQAQSPDSTVPFLHASVNQIQSTLDVAQFRFGAGIFQSNSLMRNNLAEAFSASRRITNSLDVGVNYFRTLSGPSPSGSNVSMSIRETLSPRISLLQVVNYSQGHVNVLYGGSYLSNRFTVSVDYQTLYFPFGTNPFSQGINVSLRIRFGSLQINAQTFRSADGRLRYTAFADSLMTPNFRPVGTHEESAFTHLRYIARGHVRDETSTPIEGAAIRVGDQVILTNADGEFFIRRRKADTLPLEVVFGEFLNAAPFRVISAPATAEASLDGTGSEALIILGRE